MKRRSLLLHQKLVILLVVICLLTLSYVGQLGFGNKTDPKTGLDERAVTVLQGVITHVRDGDTLEINEIPVRISALDCPENTTNSGKSATRFAKRFKNKQAICELTGAKTYDREVGYCSINGKDFARTMVENTSCIYWCKYDVWDRYC